MSAISVIMMVSIVDVAFYIDDAESQLSRAPVIIADS